jgi:histidinol-phosphate aminotransferase
MDRVRSATARFKDLEPYDPRYLPARVYLNANENPYGIPALARASLQEQLGQALLNRYPDPLAKQLRERLAVQHGLEPECVLLGNGGDELLFDVCLAYGGPGRKLLVAPPTFAVYDIDAILTGTELLRIERVERVESVNQSGDLGDSDIRGGRPQSPATPDTATYPPPHAARRLSFEPERQAILRHVSRGEVDIVILTSPNNPTGDCLDAEFVEQLLNASDALVLIDHAYIEFSDPSFNVQYLLGQHKNLAVLRTFSKAYALAGMRIGYLLAAPEVIRQLLKVRQPYSVDAVSALAAMAVLDAQEQVDRGIAQIVAQRRRLEEALTALPQLLLVPSQANYLLFRLPYAHEVWQRLYDEYSILLRDLSRAPGLTDCLRVSVGTAQENSQFIAALQTILEPSGVRGI